MGLLDNPSRRSSTALRCRLQVEALESRVVPYALSGGAWGHPELVTISFVPDGTILGTDQNGYVYSNLFQTFNARFGSAATWQREILRAAQSWAQQTNINIDVVADDGGAIGAGLYKQGDPAEGDIRIGGYTFNNSYLATAYMPPTINDYAIAGDVQFNTSQNWNIGSTFDLYTVATHEIGHALGLNHSSISSAEMWASYNGIKSSLRTDDINGIRAVYSGARAADANEGLLGNDTLTTATDLTLSINPVSLTALVQNLDVTATTDVDYYRFAAPLLTSSNLTVNVQSAGLSMLTPTVTVYAADGSTVLGTASSAGQLDGSTLSLTVHNVLPLQIFYVKVTGGDSTAFSTGKYALTLNFGTGASPTVPLPNTTTLNGSTTGGGQGQAFTIDEFGVNTTTAGDQRNSVIAMAPNGNYVIAWASADQDGSGWGVYAQRYDANSVPQGGEFRVNTTTTGDQVQPSVAMDAAGNFVIAWSSALTNGGSWGVYAQRYNANGVAQGGEIHVNTTTAGDQNQAAVAMDASGNFVVVWASEDQDGSGWGVYGQRYNASGAAQGGEFRVNTTTVYDQKAPSVAMDASGNFVVVWASDSRGRNGWGVYGQRYDASGAAQGGEFRVNTTRADDQKEPSVAMDASGNFVVVWASEDQDGSGWGVYGQRYDASGAAQGGEFRVNTTTANEQKEPSVAMDANGNYVVLWASYGQDGSGWGVYGQRYDATGAAQGSEFRANTTTSGDQRYAALAMDRAGRFVATWSTNTGSTGWGVSAKAYQANNSLRLNLGMTNEVINGFRNGTADAMSVTEEAHAFLHGLGCSCPACTRSVAPAASQMTVEVTDSGAAVALPGTPVDSIGPIAGVDVVQGTAAQLPGAVMVTTAPAATRTPGAADTTTTVTAGANGNDRAESNSRQGAGDQGRRTKDEGRNQNRALSSFVLRTLSTTDEEAQEAAAVDLWLNLSTVYFADTHGDQSMACLSAEDQTASSSLDGGTMVAGLALVLGGATLHSQLDKAEKRRAQRMQVCPIARIVCRRKAEDVEPDLSLAAVDISETGVRLLLSSEVEVGAGVDLSLHGVAMPRVLRRSAKVVWSQSLDDGRCTVGLQFESPLTYADMLRFVKISA